MARRLLSRQARFQLRVLRVSNSKYQTNQRSSNTKMANVNPGEDPVQIQLLGASEGLLIREVADAL